MICSTHRGVMMITTIWRHFCSGITFGDTGVHSRFILFSFGYSFPDFISTFWPFISRFLRAISHRARRFHHLPTDLHTILRGDCSGVLPPPPFYSKLTDYRYYLPFYIVLFCCVRHSTTTHLLSISCYSIRPPDFYLHLHTDYLRLLLWFPISTVLIPYHHLPIHSLLYSPPFVDLTCPVVHWYISFSISIRLFYIFIILLTTGDSIPNHKFVPTTVPFLFLFDWPFYIVPPPPFHSHSCYHRTYIPVHSAIYRLPALRHGYISTAAGILPHSVRSHSTTFCSYHHFYHVLPLSDLFCSRTVFPTYHHHHLPTATDTVVDTFLSTDSLYHHLHYIWYVLPF